jgi:leucine dehydrogenase
MKAAAQEAYGSDSLQNKKVALQGVGSVGYNLVKHLREEGAEVVVCDLYEDNIKKVTKDFDVEVVDTDRIYGVDCDIFAPAALGGVINEETLKELTCDIIAGPANNQLEEPDKHGVELEEKGMIYAPDYVINGGGVINVAEEFAAGGYDADRSKRKVETIYDKIQRVFAIAKRDDIPTYKAADVMAKERINQVGNRNNILAAQK